MTLSDLRTLDTLEGPDYMDDYLSDEGSSHNPIASLISRQDVTIQEIWISLLVLSLPTPESLNVGTKTGSRRAILDHPHRVFPRFPHCCLPWYTPFICSAIH